MQVQPQEHSAESSLQEEQDRLKRKVAPEWQLTRREMMQMVLE